MVDGEEEDGLRLRLDLSGPQLDGENVGASKESRETAFIEIVQVYRRVSISRYHILNRFAYDPE